MICAYTSICEKCFCCCIYFSAYLAFFLEVVQLFNLIFLILLQVLTDSNSGLTVAAIVFNVIHNVVTCLIAGFRGNTGADVINLNTLLCCYLCCPDCGCCWNMIFGIFNCGCIVDCFDCFDSYLSLMIEVIIQIVSGVLTSSLGITASNTTEKSFAKIAFAMCTVFIFFGAFNYLLNLICLIHYFVTTCRKEPVYNQSQPSDKQDQPTVQGNETNNGQPVQLQNDNNVQPPIPNQNQDLYSPPVATLQNNEDDVKKMDSFDPENPKNFNQNNLFNQENTENPK